MAFLRLKPVYKHSLWGNTRLKEQFNKQTDASVISESWELSVHPDGYSLIDSGNHKGKTLAEYLGFKENFPLLIKFIDTRQSTSIQVHPTQKYADKQEDVQAKTEAWYIADADKDAFLYMGFTKDMTEQEVRDKIQNNTLSEVLHKIPVQKGDLYFVPAGLIHAIGANILLYEVQQNSNTTYRLYDFNRRDQEGNLRALQVKEALEVMDFSVYHPEQILKEIHIENGYEQKDLLNCDYFRISEITIHEKYSFTAQKPFMVFTCLNGEGIIYDKQESLTFRKGDTVYSDTEGILTIKGNCEVIQTTL